MLRTIARGLKNAVLPGGKQFRKLRFGPAAGCTMLIDFHSHFTLFLGLYEWELERHFRTLIGPGDKCYDVGGQSGYDALLMSKLSGGGDVLAFECEPDAANEMRKTFARNAFPIRTLQSFVGRQDGENSVSLDAVALQTFVPDFVKVDIEGAEVDALLGAQSLLATRKPSMIIEVHGFDAETKCLEILRAHRYDPLIVDQRRWLRERRPLLHNRWLICAGRQRIIDSTRAGTV